VCEVIIRLVSPFPTYPSIIPYPNNFNDVLLSYISFLHKIILENVLCSVTYISKVFYKI